MATTASNALGIASNKSEIDLITEFINKSLQPKDGISTTSTTDDTLFPIQNTGEDVKFIRKADFLTAVFSSVRRISDTVADNEVTDINQLCIGSKTGINDGAPWLGYTTFYPPTQNSHINFIIQF